MALTKRNLHVLIVKEDGVTVHAAAYATHRAAKAAWVDFVAEAASPETALYEELLALSLKVERDGDTTALDLIEYGISELDLIEWWVNRPGTWGNEARFYEVQDKR